MVIENPILPLLEWLPRATLHVLVVVGILLLVALVVGYCVATLRYGPLGAGDRVYRVIRTALGELPRFSSRRVWALARLAIKESLRRRVWVVFALFMVILMFAGWFLDQNSPDPLKLYVSFVLTSTSYLVLSLALFLSAFSLPQDIQSKTIHTVVTKPVRSGEIVLGRVLGFGLVGTVMLALMGFISYGFVVTSLQHSHDVATENLEEIREEGEVVGFTGRTTNQQGHRHEFEVSLNQDAATDSQQQHWHVVNHAGDVEHPDFQVGRTAELFEARIPIYGDLRFVDRNGQDAERGISVGNEWGYRSFVQGRSRAAGIWTFTDVTPDEYGDGLPVELKIRVFRSHKGIIGQGIAGSLMLRNPETGLRSELITFVAKDNEIDHHILLRTQLTPTGEEIDLFDDLVAQEKDHSIEIWVRCEEAGQYFGMAKPDCYLRAAGGRFDVNFFKGFVGIWAQMMLVVGIGVFFSTFLSGPVAMVATLGAIVLGMFSDFLLKVMLRDDPGGIPGGGPIESLVRIITQRNQMVDLQPGIGTSTMEAVDGVMLYLMQLYTYLLPDFRKFNNSDWVASGFSIPQGLVAQNLVTCFAYLIGVYIAGYFFLRIREVAK